MRRAGPAGRRDGLLTGVDFLCHMIISLNVRRRETERRIFVSGFCRCKVCWEYRGSIQRTTWCDASQPLRPDRDKGAAFGERMMRRKICAASACEDIAVAGLAHCDFHEAQRQERLKVSRAKAQTSPEAAAARRLYADPRWVAASRRFLRRHPLCADCGELGGVEPATQVDHIERHRGDRRLFWDRSNWQALCQRCHSRKTAREVFHGA